MISFYTINHQISSWGLIYVLHVPMGAYLRGELIGGGLKIFSGCRSYSIKNFLPIGHDATIFDAF